MYSIMCILKLHVLSGVSDKYKICNIHTVYLYSYTVIIIVIVIQF